MLIWAFLPRLYRLSASALSFSVVLTTVFFFFGPLRAFADFVAEGPFFFFILM